MAKIKFELVTPEKIVFSKEVDSLSCPTIEGQITILPGHLPLIAPLDHGELIARAGDKPEYIAVSGGFVEVRPGNEVVILADSAEHAEEIDEQRAEEARRKAAEDMKEAKMNAEDYANLAAVLQKNLTRLKVAQRKSHRGKHGVGSEGVLKQ